MKRLTVHFYSTAAGNMPVYNWIKALEKEDRQRIGTGLKEIEWSWPVPPPLVKSLRPHPFWEMRRGLTDETEARIIFGVDGKLAVLLSAFIKKSQKTPEHELDTAHTRWTDYKKRKPKPPR